MNNANFHNNNELNQPKTIEDLCVSIQAAIRPQYRETYNKVFAALMKNMAGTKDQKEAKVLLIFARMSKKYREGNKDFGLVKSMIPKYIRKEIIKNKPNAQYIKGRDNMIGSLLYHTFQLDLENIPEKLRALKKATPKLSPKASTQSIIFSPEVLNALTLDKKQAYKDEYNLDDDFPFVKTNIKPGHMKEFSEVVAGRH